MVDHVAVLRVMRTRLRDDLTDDEYAALDHAIAAVEAAEPHVVGDILYRINSYVLTGNLTDAEFRQNAEPIVEDIRGYLSGLGYEVMPETDAKHAALVARLGELERFLRNRHVGDESEAGDLARIIADDLARVVAGNGGET